MKDVNIYIYRERVLLALLCCAQHCDKDVYICSVPSSASSSVPAAATATIMESATIRSMLSVERMSAGNEWKQVRRRNRF